MPRLPRTYAQRFFLVSTAVVVVSGLLTVALTILIAQLYRDRYGISLTDMDHAIHDIAPSIAATWDNKDAWSSEFQAMRAKLHLKPVRINVLATDGRVLLREGDLLGRFMPVGATRMNQTGIVTLLAGKEHIEDDWVYAVAPVQRDGAIVGFLTIDLQPYSQYRYQSGGLPFFMWLILPILATAIISMLASIYLTRDLRRRLARFSSAIQAMAEGDYRSRLAVESEDEIGQVATSFNRMADKLEAARAQEQLTEQFKRELITNVSHDLRGPLASVQGYVEALEEGLAGDPATIRRYAGIIRQKSERLAQLVGDLLLYARLESGHLPLRLETVDVAEWLRQNLSDVEPDITMAGLTLEADIPEQCGNVRIDVSKMRQVLANLTQNAVRHAPAGSQLRVALQIVADSASITFADEGPGLDVADIPHLFDRFYRGRDQAEGMGIGLGLAIAAQIVRAHGGRIWAENAPAAGAIFRFTLPIAVE